MRLIIYDPMLKEAYGHHLPVTKFIYDEGIRRGFDVEVLAHKDLPIYATRLPFRRECRSEFYTWFEEDEALKGILLYTKENAIIQQDLCRLLNPKELNDGDTVVMHTFLTEHLLGLLDWFERVEARIKLRLFTYFPPWRAGLLRQDLAEPIARYVLTRWHRTRGNVKFFTENADLAAVMASVSPVPFHVIPPPVDFAGTKPAPRRMRKDGGFIWIYPGEARWEKGIRFLPEAWRTHRERFPSDTIKVQYLVYEKAVLDKLGGAENGVKVIPRALHGAEYFAHLASGDFVLFPYEPVEYHYRMSHLVIETLSMGRPIVATGGTWQEKEALSYGPPAGMGMREWSVDGLLLAMAEARRNAEQLQTAAEEVAPLVRAKYEHKKFFEEFVHS